MKKFLNYLGQLRLYSLVDLALLLYVVKASAVVFVGAIFLWVGFLAYLEFQHKHSNRLKIPSAIWIIITLIGAVLYRRVETLAFIVCSYFYTKKKGGHFTYFSPLFRGLQNFFLIAGIIGYHNHIVWVVFLATMIRNILGDLRDAGKDRKEGMNTIPVILGLQKNIKYIHLAGVLITSLIWWSYGGLAWWILALVWLIELGTYNLTPR